MAPDALATQLARAGDHLAACGVVVDHLAANPDYKPSVYLERGGRLRCAAARTYLQVFDGMPPGAGVIGQTFATGEPFLDPDVTAHEQYLEITPLVRAEACAPVRAHGKVIGAVNVESFARLDQTDADAVGRAADALGARLAELGGGLRETPAQRLVRHATRLTDVNTRGRVEREVLEAAADVAGMDSAVLLTGGPDGEVALVDAIGPLAARIGAAPQEALRTVLQFVQAGTSCFTVGESGGQDFSGLARLREAGVGALAMLGLSDHPSRVLVVADSTPREIVTETIELLELLVTHAASALRVSDLVVDLRAQAATDPLTGLGHHRGFYTRLHQTVDHATAVILIDLDHFKVVNDTHGHVAGDRLLRSVAAAMQAAVRDADDVFRVGGDEFAILAKAHDADEANEIAERVVVELRERTSVTASVGACLAPAGRRLDDALLLADRALYAAKAAGRNRALSHEVG